MTMKKWLITLFVVLVTSINAWAQSLASTGHEALTVSTTSVPITATVYQPTAGGNDATRCIVVAETAAIRYRTDGTAPTSSVGLPLAADARIPLYGDQAIANFRAIRSGGTDATLQISCFRGTGDLLPLENRNATILDGVAATAEEIDQLAGQGSANSKGAVTEGCTFVEDASNTAHTCTITLPAGSWLISIQVVTTVLWTDADTSLEVGDADDPNGWFDDVDLAATDLLVGEVLDISQAENWGGAQGVYLVAATGRKGQAIAAFSGVYVPTASEVIGIVNMTTPTGTAGRTHMVVTYVAPTLVTATAS